MPGKNGYEVCASSRSIRNSATLPWSCSPERSTRLTKKPRARSAPQHTSQNHSSLRHWSILSCRFCLKTGPKRAAADRCAAGDLNQLPPPAAMPKDSALPSKRCRPSREHACACSTAPLRHRSGTAPSTVTKEAETGDLLGLNDLFQPPVAERLSAASVSDEEIDRIADRVIQKLSTQVIENVAWDVVPDITAKVLREELKRQS